MSTVNLDEMNQVERQALLFKLLDGVVGPLRFGDLSGVAIIPIGADVGPRTTVPVVTGVRRAFRPRRLVILEPVVEREFADDVLTYRTVTSGALWWKKRREVVAERRIVRRTVAERVDRACWMIEGCWVGARVQFQSHGTIGGDAFGPSDNMEFEMDEVPPGVSITLQVRHCRAFEVPFRAVVLGQVAGARRAGSGVA